MPHLFSELTIKNKKLKNRIVMPPMCMYSADDTGCVTDFHLMHYGARALGGVGLIIVEAAAVNPLGRISPNDLGLWSDEQILGMKKLSAQIKKYGAISAVQINHAGRKSFYEDENKVYAPSKIAYSSDYCTPRKLTIPQIEEIIDQFKKAAFRAQNAEFDCIEIHAAHGYLISQFLSPLTNKRDDQYGGNHENRVRFLKEILTEIQSVFSGIISIRISASDFSFGGNTSQDLTKMLKNINPDIIHVSAGGVVPNAKIDVYSGYQLKLAEEIKNATTVPIISGGLLTSAELMNEIIQNGRADMVFVGRALLRDPHFALATAHKLGQKHYMPKCYERAPF